jgi:hypothetical protein
MCRLVFECGPEFHRKHLERFVVSLFISFVLLFLSNDKGHLPTWSKAEGRSGMAVKCTQLLALSITFI